MPRLMRPGCVPLGGIFRACLAVKSVLVGGQLQALGLKPHSLRTAALRESPHPTLCAFFSETSS